MKATHERHAHCDAFSERQIAIDEAGDPTRKKSHAHRIVHWRMEAQQAQPLQMKPATTMEHSNTGTDVALGHIDWSTWILPNSQDPAQTEAASSTGK